MWDKERKKNWFFSLFAAKTWPKDDVRDLVQFLCPLDRETLFNSRKSRKKTSFALTIAKLAERRAENKKSKFRCAHMQKNVIKTSLYFSLKNKIFSIKAGYWASFKEQNYLKRVKNLSVFPGGTTNSKFLQTLPSVHVANPTWGTFPAVFEAPP